jgi:putative flippase GtrA
MTKKDIWSILAIGTAIGLLVQPILTNILTTDLNLVVRLGVFLFFFILAPAALAIAYLLSKAWKAIYQFAQFAAVGSLNSFIDIGIFNLETFIFGSSIGVVMFATLKAISFLFATTNSFVWNKYWTFNSTDKASAGEVGGFYAVAIIGWVVNVGVATLVKSIGPDTKTWVNLVAPLAGIAVTFIWNFIGYKFWVFKNTSKGSGAATKTS